MLRLVCPQSFARTPYFIYPVEMDRSADLEMPSPKRMRLEAPEADPALDPPTLVDDMDDLYGTPPLQLHSPTKSSYVLAPALSKPASPMDQKSFRLPGLGMFNGDPTPPEFPHQQPQPGSSFLEMKQTSFISDVKDMEPEDEQRLRISGRLDAVIDDERTSSILITGPEIKSVTSSEITVDGNTTEVAKSEERVSEAGIAKSQGAISSGSELAQVALDWHSSGTVVDCSFWLPGKFSTENAPSTAQASDTGKRGSHAEALQDNDFSLNAAKGQEKAFSVADPGLEQSDKTILKEPMLEELAKGNQDDEEEAEFELDSSPLGSDSSSDDSSDTSSSDDSDADDYEMLSPAEQASRLMAEDGGSDDDGKGKGRKVVAEVPRTLNEKPDEVVPKPTVAVTEDMRIEELGLVENTVDNVALIKANTSGEYQVLESGSLLCLQDRSVIGVVSETLGRVQQPYYSVRFTNATAIAEAGIEKSTKIFYVAQYSTTVFTQPLKAFKGSDASNLHDEEVCDDELEFSDDEAEAEHRRQVKQQRMAKRNARDGQADGFSRGPQQRHGGSGPRLKIGLHPVQEHPPNTAEVALNYDDADGKKIDRNEDEDGLYTPLIRPSNLHEILSGKAPPMDNLARRGNIDRGRGDSRGGNRGRGDNRGRGGNRGIRDSERGGKHSRKDRGNHGGKGQPHGHPSPPRPQTHGFSPPQPNGLPPRPRPETTGYQRSTHQGNSFPHPPPQQSPIPPPVHQAQPPPQSQTYPSYPPQYPNAYNQPYFQQPPPHQPYPPHFPQQNHSQYHQPQQPISRQGYMQQFAPQPDMSFPPQSQYPPFIPHGAHINPNLFKQQGQSPAPQGWQQGYNLPQPQQQQAFPASHNEDPAAPASNPARLQDLLRGLGRGGG